MLFFILWDFIYLQSGESISFYYGKAAIFKLISWSTNTEEILISSFTPHSWMIRARWLSSVQPGRGQSCPSSAELCALRAGGWLCDWRGCLESLDPSQRRKQSAQGEVLGKLQTQRESAIGAGIRAQENNPQDADPVHPSALLNSAACRTTCLLCNYKCGSIWFVFAQFCSRASCRPSLSKQDPATAGFERGCWHRWSIWARWAGGWQGGERCLGLCVYPGVGFWLTGELPSSSK